MRLSSFIRENRAELAKAIGDKLSFVPRTASCYCHKSGTDHRHEPPKLTNEDIREWVLSDESLYNWARSAGCKI